MTSLVSVDHLSKRYLVLNDEFERRAWAQAAVAKS